MTDTRKHRADRAPMGLAADQAFVPKPDVASRLRDAIGLLEAIDHGELLAGLPMEPGDRRRHDAALAVLATLNRDLERLLAEVRAHDELTAFSALEADSMGLRRTIAKI